MARERGTFNFSASLEIKKEGALDARQVVNTKAELTQASTWLDDDNKIWLYNGLLVCVVADTDINNGVYFLIDKDNYTTSTNWVKIGSISGSTPDELLEAINNALEEAKAYTDDKAGTITFTGAVNATYNGTQDISVNIPTASGGVADSVDWSNVTNKPNWIGSSKPTYSFSEISGTIAIGDLPTGTTGSTVALGNHTHSNYLTSSSLSGYATQTWVTSQINGIDAADIGAAAAMHTHVFSDITFNNTGTNSQYLAGDGKFYTIGWNEISGKPSTFSPSSHTHSASDITSGTLSISRLPTGTTSSTVALGNHTHSQYLTSSSLSGYATETWVNQQIAAIDIPDTSGFVTLTGAQTISGAKTFTNSNGVRSTYGFYDTSDIRLKSNIQDIELKDKINLYEFDKQGKHSYGVIAQEVEQLYPSVVNTDENGYKTVNYNEVLSIKCAELEAENKELKARLDKLEALVNSLL